MDDQLMGMHRNWEFFNFVADDLQLGVVVATVVVRLDRYVPAYEPDGGCEEGGSGHQVKM